jgi:hypothetical protein|tara:strand:+ start:1696 stop:1968 length:273 start_codon:yes stop_codon:yes gene_type:complete
MDLSKISENFSKYAVILGVVITLGGGFIAWGQFNARLDNIEASQGSDAVEKLEARVAELETSNQVLRKTNEVLNAKMNELALKVSNPLGN